MTILKENRRINSGNVFLLGLLVGAICYVAAEALIPRNVATPGDHDLLLANRLGYFYASAVGLYLAWLQRSFRRALWGLAIGGLLGTLYQALSSSRDFLAIMIGFPCLLGGVLAALLGSNRSSSLSGLGGRLGKGLIGGIALGLIYSVTLNLVGAMWVPLHMQDMPRGECTERYIYMMWRAGPVALALASGTFFILIRWAVGLSRIKMVEVEQI